MEKKEGLQGMMIGRRKRRETVVRNGSRTARTMEHGARTCSKHYTDIDKERKGQKLALATIATENHC
jgi:hypothetical protein